MHKENLIIKTKLARCVCICSGIQSSAAGLQLYLQLSSAAVVRCGDTRHFHPHGHQDTWTMQQLMAHTPAPFQPDCVNEVIRGMFPHPFSNMSKPEGTEENWKHRESPAREGGKEQEVLTKEIKKKNMSGIFK